MQRLGLILGIVILSLTNRQANAWNDVGHMTVARIAYERLNESERQAIVSILRNHPHLHEILLKDRQAHVSEDEWIFVHAATWPDHVRPPRFAVHEPVHSHSIYQFHHATWHYANFEYHAGQKPAAMPMHPMTHHSQPGHQEERTDIIEQLDRSYLIVRGAESERSEPEIGLSREEIRAIRLCWLFHLIGDIHQPLHVIALVDEQIPELKHGDEGGNKLAIRVNHTSAPKKLHAFWDDLLGTNSHFDKVAQLAEMLTRDPKLNSSRLAEYSQHRQAHEFAEESYQAARDFIYQNGRLHFALWSRVESHSLAETDVPVLPQQVVDQAHSLAIRRVTLAGYRLADRLKFIVSRNIRSSPPPIDVASPIPIRPGKPQLVR